MSERLAEVGRRVATVRQLGTVVNAMRGIAGARAQQARARLPAIRAYADTAGRAIAEARRVTSEQPAATADVFRGKPGLVVFGAEQGFAGAFPRQILDAAAPDFAVAHVFMVGSRTAALAAERSLVCGWRSNLPSSVSALTETAVVVVEAVYAYLADAGPAPVAMLYPVWNPGHRARIVRRSLLPLDEAAFVSGKSGPPPLVNLSPADLIMRLAQEYILAQLCEATAEAFAAENEARAATMASAKTNIDARLTALEAEERLTRQEEITAEVVELAAGARFRL